MDPLIESAKEIEALREALAQALIHVPMYASTTEAIGRKALATPDDSSALDAALKAERERIAKHYDTTMPSVSQHIRGLK